jgi:hypothetical protein
MRNKLKIGDWEQVESAYKVCVPRLQWLHSSSLFLALINRSQSSAIFGVSVSALQPLQELNQVKDKNNKELINAEGLPPKMFVSPRPCGGVCVCVDWIKRSPHPHHTVSSQVHPMRHRARGCGCGSMERKEAAEEAGGQVAYKSSLFDEEAQ